MVQGAPYPGIFQVAYVTRDMDAAQARFRETHGIGHFLDMRDMRYATRNGRMACSHVALAYSGAVEIELIQPIDGDVEHYRQLLPEGGAVVRFHHLCRRFANEEALDEQVRIYADQGRHFPILADVEGFKYFYCDFVAELGHYVEGIFFREQSLEWLASIPRF